MRRRVAPLVLPGVESDSAPVLRREPEGLRRWAGSSHGVRVEVYSGTQECWLVLAPVNKDTSGVESMQRVLARYLTMVRSLAAQSPRVRRYDLQAVRLVVQVPEARPTFVVEAIGDKVALQQLREVEAGTTEIAPLRLRRPKRRKGKSRGKTN